MNRLLLIGFLFISLIFKSQAQVVDTVVVDSLKLLTEPVDTSVNMDFTIERDSIQEDSIEIIPVIESKDSVLLDSVVMPADTSTLDIDMDSIPGVKQSADTTELYYREDSSFHETSDTTLKPEEVTRIKTYEEVLDFVDDSLYFEQSDTIHYVIYKLNYFLQKDSMFISDTTRQAIAKLIQHTKNQQIDTVLTYLQNKLEIKNRIEIQDSSLMGYRDSIFHAVEFLMESIPEDSLNLSFTNSNKDSVLLLTAENEIDSVRLNLYDNRGEYANLWIKKSEKDLLGIYLEDGIYIEKAKERKVVNQKLDTEFGIPTLREVDKVSKILAIWEFEGLADVRFNQGYISDSWSEGGESSISALSILKYSADYSYGKLRTFDFDTEYRLGYIQAGDNDLRKNDDKFELNAKYGRSAFNDWYYSTLFNFKTQFIKGFEYPNDSTKTNISQFLNPAYMVFSLGLDYKPSSKLTVLISPLTAKFTIVADTVRFDQTRFGVGQNEYIRKELGAYVKAISKIKFRDNISLENKINFFTNYTEKPQNIDVNWELDLKVKITDYITMSVNAHFIYDDDVKFIDEDGNERGARAQFKELLGVGFEYSF